MSGKKFVIVILDNVQNGQIKYGKLRYKEDNQTPWNKIYVDIFGPYVIQIQVKETIHPKVNTMINFIIGGFKLTQNNDKFAITIANLVETIWLTRYPLTSEITYNQG